MVALAPAEGEKKKNETIGNLTKQRACIGNPRDRKITIKSL
jgi:hypothetical protein